MSIQVYTVASWNFATELEFVCHLWFYLMHMFSPLSQEEEGEETAESGSSTQEEEESAIVQRSEFMHGVLLYLYYVA